MKTLLAITPARDEAEYLPRLIESMTNQTVPPDIWLVVNDGSQDATPNLVQNAIRHHKWIRLLERPDRGFRQRGAGVVNAFMVGLQDAGGEHFDFVAKIDADLSFEPDFIESLITEFDKDHRLGICGGGILEQKQGVWQTDRILPTDFVRGMNKIYRMTCFSDIGGLAPCKGWDGIDNVRAILRGWRVQRFDSITAKHHRAIGAQEGALKARYTGGIGAYNMGSDPLVMLFRGLHMMCTKPYVLAGLAMVAGYFGSMLTRKPNIGDSEVIAYIRKRERQLIRHGRFGW